MAVYQSGHIVSITSVSESFPHGQYLSYAVIEYDRNIACKTLVPELFYVAHRTITAVYTNTEPKKTDHSIDGPFVILELSLQDADAPMLFDENEEGRVPRNSPPPIAAGMPSAAPDSYAVCAENRLEITQCGKITACDGTILPPVRERIATCKSHNLIADDFMQFTFEDISYNLFVPAEYSEVKTYPMVLFIPDASVLGTDPLLALYQGNGALSFASARDQALHASFVLAPVFPSSYKLKSDDGLQKATKLIDKLIRLIDYISGQYTIDQKRIYATGQSFGCITLCALNICYPKRIAASILVAGQWDALEMSSLSNKELWFITSDGDARAYPSMNAIISEMEKRGASVNRNIWNAKDSSEKLSSYAKAAAEDSCNIHYTIFENNSVVPEKEEINPISNHVNTWPAAYAIDEIRDWLFTITL